MSWLFNALPKSPLFAVFLTSAFGLVTYHYPPPIKELWAALHTPSLWDLLIPFLAVALFTKAVAEEYRRVVRRDVAAAFVSLVVAIFALWAAAHVGWWAMRLGYYLPFAVFPGLAIVVGLLFLAKIMARQALVGHLPKRVDTIVPRQAKLTERPMPKPAKIEFEPTPNPYKGVVGIPRSHQMYHY